MKKPSNRILYSRTICSLAAGPILLGLLLTGCGDPTATNQPPATSAPAATTAAATNAPPTSAAPTNTSVAPTNAPATNAAPANPTAPTQTSGSTAGPTNPAALAKDEQEVSFASGKETLYGTLLLPQTGQNAKLAAAILISGSGPTDRNGNNTLIPGAVNSHSNFARILADQGVASLRYDKLGTGKTGLGSYASRLGEVDFNVYLEEARDAYNYLKGRPEIDPQRMLILGHSEGGLIALVVADQLKDKGGPKALILAAPVSRPYLETLRNQIAAQYEQAQKNGLVTKEQAEAGLKELDDIIKSLLETGKQPPTISNPAFKPLFNPINDKFLATVGKYDPPKVAAGLSPTLPVLALCGLKDIQVLCSDVQNLMQGFQKAGNTRAVLYQLADVNHVFKEVPGATDPNPLVDYANPNLKFSQEATAKMAAFVKANL